MGLLINGITQEGLIYEVEEKGRTLYEWNLLHPSILQEVLTHLKEESFA